MFVSNSGSTFLHVCVQLGFVRVCGVHLFTYRMQRHALFAARSAVSAATSAGSRAASAASSPGASSIGGLAYNLVFRRNVTYVSYVLVGAIVLEGVYGTVTDGLWSSMNKGVGARARGGGDARRTRLVSHTRARVSTRPPRVQRTYDSVDWSKFKVADEEGEFLSRRTAQLRARVGVELTSHASPLAE